METESTTNTTLAIPWAMREVWLGVALFGVWVVTFLGFALINAYFEWGINPGVSLNLGEVALIVPVWWLTVYKYGVGWHTLGFKKFDGIFILIGFGLMLLALGFNFGYGALLSLFDARIQPDLAPILQELSLPWIFLFGGAIVAPFAEEVFFRGFIFNGVKKTYGWQTGMVASAAFFAIIHFTPTAIIPLFIMGCIFAYLYQISGSIWPAILMHTANNTLALTITYLIAEGYIEIPEAILLLGP